MRKTSTGLKTKQAIPQGCRPALPLLQILRNIPWGFPMQVDGKLLPHRSVLLPIRNNQEAFQPDTGQEGRGKFLQMKIQQRDFGNSLVLNTWQTKTDGATAQHFMAHSSLIYLLTSFLQQSRQKLIIEIKMAIHIPC